MTARRRLLLTAGIVLLAFARTASAARPSGVDFERDVRPILASRCLKCHGSGTAEAGLRLDERDSATAELESGQQAVVEGDPNRSELLRRVAASDDFERMPPSGPSLSAKEIEILRAWIAGGAPWPDHWAYHPFNDARLPSLPGDDWDDWIRTPIDRFILAELLQRGLAPSPMADKRTLLRRVYFDLIGLPPTADEMDAFLADNSPDAYDRVVDRLLADPRYGERWARHWMDLVHFAETHGHDQDRPRENAWPYRDYLIDAFNEDKPYARFVREQVAGDILFPEDPDAVVATGMLAAGPWDESSLRDIREDTLDREIARYVDRDDVVTMVMATFTSTTVHCARCHEHKFDPISQADYYALQAVFAGIDKANRPYDPDPAVARRRQEWTEQQARLADPAYRPRDLLLAADLQNEVSAWESQLDENARAWQTLEVIECRSQEGSELKTLNDGSILAGGPRPEKDVYTIDARTSLAEIAGIRLEILTDASLPHSGPGRQDNGNLHLNEFAVSAFDSDDSTSEQAVELIQPRADFDQDGWSIDKALDANPATAWGIYPEVGKSHWAVFCLKQPLTRSAGRALRFQLHQVHGGGHLIGRLQLSVTDRRPVPAGDRASQPPAITAILATPIGQRTEAQRMDLAAHYLRQKLDRQLADLPPQQMVYCGTNQFQPEGSFRPAQTPRTVHILHRGDVRQPGDEAQPGALSCLPELPARFQLADPRDESLRRIALADWLVDSRNVLVWRSIANRLWQHHFGRGLVDTPNDFGRMGAAPSHPELLDWLALRLQSSGGSLKTLQRLIVTSAAYRQSSMHRGMCAQVDADNRLLWRMNRRRLDAECVRDALLSLTGTMDTTMGGPSARQFIQTPGVHVTPNVDYANFDVNDPANYRRSVYRFLFRSLPDPFMDALDCPDGSQLTPNRNESLTALQALATLNDKYIVRLSQHLADGLGGHEADPGRQIDDLYRRLFGRLPDEDEAAAVADYASRHGLANACRMLINSNEFLFVD